MRCLMIAVAALLASACSPMTGPPITGGSAGSPLPGQSVEVTACAARGGEIRRVGRMQSEQCVIKYGDALKPCADNGQCLGDCRVEGDIGTPADASVSGRCQVDSDRFGCHTTIAAGKAEPTLCID